MSRMCVSAPSLEAVQRLIDIELPQLMQHDSLTHLILRIAHLGGTPTPRMDEPPPARMSLQQKHPFTTNLQIHSGSLTHRRSKCVMWRAR